MKKEIIFYFIFFSLILFIIIFKYCTLNNHYKKIIKDKENNIIYGLSAPRGRIFDVNGNVLVDNKQINNLYFYYDNSININVVVDKLSDIIDFPKPNEKEQINYYKYLYNEDDLLTDEEQTKYYERKISNEEKEEIINQRIIELIKDFSTLELNKAKIYSLINEGAIYYPKLLKENITDNEVNLILNEDISGLKIEIGYERYYPYGDSLKTILGSVGNIAKENKSEYLSKGYNLNDTVGLSYLEKYYDDYLKGKKAQYLVNSDNSLTKVSDYEKGNDLYLSIDINLQLEVENIIKENLIKAKTKANTDYLSDSYSIISNPKTGEIRAIAGKRYLSNEEFNDVVINNITSSFTMGSVVKGATISVGYKYNLIDPDKKIYDSCVKLNHLTEKCSWKELGYLNSTTALEQSSNYYQFLIAIGLTGNKYTYNMDLNISEKEFNIYRQMLMSYGLGQITGIDLPNEKNGIIGDIISPDLYLNLSIGQYDTYTPIQLITYINTLANNGSRLNPSLVSFIKDNNGNIIYQKENKVVSTVDLNEEDIKLIQQGFYNVMNRGTGKGFMNKELSVAGKTGTSESFLDTDNDGKVDKSTMSLTMAGYFPFEDPLYSIVVICPHASYVNNKKDYIYYITSKISSQITNYMKTYYGL